MLRVYTGVVGVVLLVTGTGGLLDIWNITPGKHPLYPDDIVYLLTGILLCYLGFRQQVSGIDSDT